MALNAGSAELGTGLAGELYSALNVAFGGAASEALVDADRKKVCDVIAATLISHFKANAVVTTTVAVTSVGGVTVGLGISGSGAGTGSGGIA